MALLLAVFAAFSPALTAEFVNFDDDKNITENFYFRGLSARHLDWMFSTHKMGHYQPLSWITLALDYKLWGFEGTDPTHAAGFHFTNILLHALTVLAFFYLARRLLPLAIPSAATLPASRIAAAALLAALLFGVHPLRCESVCWVTERRDVLSGLFFVLTLIAYVRYATQDQPSRWLWYALSVGLLLLSLLSKAWGIVMPAVLLILDAYPLRRLPMRERQNAFELVVFVEKIPFVTLSLIFMAVAKWAQAGQLDTMKSLAQHGLLARVAQGFYGLAFYPLKSLLPWNLIPIHEIPLTINERPFEPPIIAAAAGVLLITGVLIWQRRRWPAALAAWICYAAIVSPVLGVMQSGPQFVADRYSYLSCMPFALLAAGAVLLAWRVALPVMLAASLVLGGICFMQARVWRSSDTLWSHTVKVNPSSATALLNLGIVRKAQGQRAMVTGNVPLARTLLRESIDLYDRGNALEPNPRNFSNAANAYSILSDITPAPEKQTLFDKALQNCRRAIELSQQQNLPLPEFRLNYGVLLLKQGRSAEALVEFQYAVEKQPTNKNARNNLGIALRNLGNFDEALMHLGRAVELDPNYVNAWINLGDTYEKLQQWDKARDAYERALKIQPNNGAAKAGLKRIQGK